MNLTLVIQSVLKTLDLVIRLAEANNFDEGALRDYIEQRNALREQLVERAKALANDDPEQGDILTTLAEVDDPPSSGAGGDYEGRDADDPENGGVGNLFVGPVQQDAD